MSSRQGRNCESHFCPKIMTKNGVYHFYPSAKSRRIENQNFGDIFQGASAYCIQNSIAPSKQAVCRFSDKSFFDKSFYRKYLPIFFVCRKFRVLLYVGLLFSLSILLFTCVKNTHTNTYYVLQNTLLLLV